jgi:hypothetical protein
VLTPGVIGAETFRNLMLGLLALAVLVPVVLAIVSRPQRGMLLLVALAPFDGLLLILPFPSFVKGWKEVLVGIILVATWLCPQAARGSRGRRLPRWLPPLIVLIAIGLVSAAIVGGDQALLGLKVNFYYLLLGIAVWRCPPNERERDRLVSILMVTGLICSVVGLAQQAIGDARLHDLGYEYNTVIRFAGSNLRSFSTFNEPFPFALFVMTVLLIGVPCALMDLRRPRNRVFLILMPVYLLGILSAFVRSAWLGLAVGLLYLGFKRYRLLLVGLPVALVVFLLVGSNANSVSTPLLSSNSLTARTTSWSASFDQIQAHPLGLGIGTAGAVAEATTNDQTSTTGNGKPPFQPDNYYFKTVYEFGLIGLWMLILYLIGVFKSTTAIAERSSGFDRAFCDGVAATVLAAMAASLVATFFEIYPLDLLFWLLVPTVAALGAREPEQIEASTV